MKTVCPYRTPHCTGGQCWQCRRDNEGRNGCQGILTALAITLLVLAMLFALLSCNGVDKPGIENTRLNERTWLGMERRSEYTIDKVKIDSVVYIIVNGNGTAIIKHEPR